MELFPGFPLHMMGELRDSGFLDLSESYDQTIADRGYKVKTDLALKQCTLAIPPSAASGCQMVSRDIKETSTVANVHIYVEQVIKNLKDYRILKSEMQLKYLPIVDDIIRTCALNNLKKPLKHKNTMDLYLFPGLYLLHFYFKFSNCLLFKCMQHLNI